MDGQLILSIILGVGLASVNVLLSLTSLRRLATAASSDFLMRMFKGMLFRMVGVLVVFILVLWLVPVHISAFAASFLVVIVVGLVLEVIVATRSVGAAK